MWPRTNSLLGVIPARARMQTMSKAPLYSILTGKKANSLLTPASLLTFPCLFLTEGEPAPGSTGGGRTAAQSHPFILLPWWEWVGVTHRLPQVTPQPGGKGISYGWEVKGVAHVLPSLGVCWVCLGSFRPKILAVTWPLSKDAWEPLTCPRRNSHSFFFFFFDSATGRR